MMNSCKKCHAFLHDYLDQTTHKTGILAHLSNPQKIHEHKDDLIQAILRSQATITDWVIQNTKGEVQMRTSLIKKPETKDEEYLLTYYILKQIAIGFRNQVKHLEDFIIYADMVKLKRSDRTYARKDQFLANLCVPLMDMLDEIHKEHSGLPVTRYTISDDDLLYT